MILFETAVLMAALEIPISATLISRKNLSDRKILKFSHCNISKIFVNLHTLPPNNAIHILFSYLGTPLPDYEVLVAITKKNLVASSVLSKDVSRKVDFDFESHKTFPVVKLVQ